MARAEAHTLSLMLEMGRLMRSRMVGVMPLPSAQCETLWLISERERPSMRDIARHFKISAPSATSLASELARGGYLVRTSDAKDRRQVRLILTPKGRKTLRGVMERRKKVLESVLSVLSARDRADLARILSNIVSAK